MLRLCWCVRRCPKMGIPQQIIHLIFGSSMKYTILSSVGDPPWLWKPPYNPYIYTYIPIVIRIYMDYMEVTKLHFDRENDDYPVDLGAPYFQTKPKLIPRIGKMHRFSSSKPRRRSFTGVHLCESPGGGLSGAKFELATCKVGISPSKVWI